MSSGRILPRSGGGDAKFNEQIESSINPKFRIKLGIFCGGEAERWEGREGGGGGVNPRLFYKSMVRKIVKNAPVSSTCRKNQALVKKTSVETAVFLFIQFLNEKPGESS